MKKILFIAVFLVNVSSIAQTTEIQSHQRQKVKFTCYFDYNSAAWPNDSVRKMAEWLKPYLEKDAVTIDLYAYTDTIGPVAKNQTLALRRLNAVEAYFVKKNIGINKTFALGETYDKTGYKNNQRYRKVEVMVEYQEALQVKEFRGNGALEKMMQERMETFANSTAPVSLNIQFVPGQDMYIGNSYLDVVALLEYLKQNPNKKAFIRGHVCCDNDIQLSDRRAFAVYNDMLLEGVSAERISYKGFGNTIPVMPERDDYSRQQNRRVDVIFSDL